MPNTGNVSTLADGARRADHSSTDHSSTDRHNTDRNNTAQGLEGLLKTGALQTAILTSAGLPIIATDEKGIIQLFNAGAMGVDSVVGEGSVFWFELKRSTAQAALLHAEASAPVRPQAPSEALPQVPPGMRTVLYVEDNRANLILIKQLLARRPDLRLLSAADGYQGIELARAHQPQIILMDVTLPGISGIEVMKILRADPSTAHIPIMALSANALPHDIENGIKAGFFKYLTKPIKVTEFIAALDVALDFSQSASDRATGKELA